MISGEAAARRKPVTASRDCSHAAIAVAVLALLAGSAGADPWMAPGDALLRHDLQLLADAGVLSGPVLSWPIGWSQLAKEIAQAADRPFPKVQLSAVRRLRARADREMQLRTNRVDARMSVAADQTPLRDFQSMPHEEGEAELSVHRLGARLAWRASVTAVIDPDDGQALRPDGSYVAASLGNWMLAAGYLDRWWGPGWQGSLILSTNARPVPAFSIDRNEARPFDLPVLRWLGPWRLTSFMGRLEGDRDHPHTLLFGMRAEIRPLPSLQIAASRTAQWCGDDRPCGLDTFWDLLAGNDNEQTPEEQPGNQLAGFDIRWTWPGGRIPLALYTQAIGEDEAGSLPSKYLGLAGLEAWGGIGGGSWRAHVEYADTACDFVNSTPEFGCAYTNSIYTSGYRYRRRAIGHTMDADGESIGVGLMYVDPHDRRWAFLIRDFKLNRAGAAAGHTLTDVPADVLDVVLTHERAHAWGNITVSVGYADLDTAGSGLIDEGVRGFVTWSQALR